MAEIKAPYRFIPLSAWIHQPDWAADVSHDRPFKDGVSGWLDLEIEARTPILVGGQRQAAEDGSGIVDFHRLPDGRPAIPGSSQRGLIRSVLEIAAFGRAAFVDDVRYGLRDLTPRARRIYQERLVTDLGRWNDRPATKPASRAGWLRRELDDAGNENWFLCPCEYARIAVTELDIIQPGIAHSFEARSSAAERYAHWRGTRRGALHIGPVQFHSHAFRPDPDGTYKARVEIEYCEATVPAVGQATSFGEIVYTGKPADGEHVRGHVPARYFGKKKKEFFFYGMCHSEIDVTHLRHDFLFVHAEQKGRHEAENWTLWKPCFERGERIPVFWLDGGAGGVAAVGLAMMFRLPHRDTTQCLLANTKSTRCQLRHTDATILDFPTLLFGRAVDHERGDDWGLKGRVVFEPAVAPKEARRAKAITTVLASPRGQFYPAHVRQPRGANGCVAGGTYASYTPIDDATEQLVRHPELAGRKRYPVKPYAEPGAQGNDRMKTTLHPLAAGTRFTGRVRFHNLKPTELGALVWALRLWAPGWGKRPDLYHALGMGKPFGMGQVDVHLVGVRLEPNALKDGRRVASSSLSDAQAYANHFVDHMTKAFDAAKVPNSPVTWASSVQIETLLAMADPAEATKHRLDYMTLDPDHGINHFRDAKREGAVLPPYGRRAVTAGDAHKWEDEDAFPRARPVVHAARQQAPAPRDRPLAVGDRVSDRDGEIGPILRIEGDRALIGYVDGQDWTPLAELTRVR